MTDRDLTSPSTPLPSSRREWAATLDRLGVRPSKGLGQHFLYERGIVQRMVRLAGLGPADHVVEVGPGLGILTDELLLRAGQVTAIELDRRLAEHLRLVFGGNPRFRLIEGNALEMRPVDIVPEGEPFTVVANLPYAVATAVLRHLLEQTPRPQRLALMVQKEVAERIVAVPPDLTILGVASQFYTQPRIAFDVPPTVFIPPPKVESAVVILETRLTLPLPDAAHDTFFRIVRAGFRQKRKQVANALAAGLPLPKEEVSRWLSAAGIDPMRRAQTLSLQEWVTLTESVPHLDQPVSP